MKKLIIASCAFLLFTANFTFAQETITEEENQETSEKSDNSRIGGVERGAHAITLGLGTSVINGDLDDPHFEIYFQGGYKYFFDPSFNINFTYHKFNLAFKDQFNEGFMSFDLNLEWIVLPYKTFSPYLFAGGGLNAANHFDQTDGKVQAGAGLELLVSDRVGVKLFADYNHVFSDLLDGVEAGSADDTYWRIGLGLNFYFGKKLENKVSSKVPTVIDSSPIVDDY